MAKISFYGHVGKVGDLKTTSNGTEIINFTIAERNHTEVPNWWSCAAYGRTAKLIVDYVKVGHGLAVWGKVDQSKNNDKVYHNIVIEKIELTGSKNGNS